jgi:adenine-specific DNA methylase
MPNQNGHGSDELLAALRKAQEPSPVREIVRASLERSLAEKRKQAEALRQLRARKAVAALNGIVKAIEEHRAETRKIVLDLHDQKLAAKRVRLEGERMAEQMRRSRDANAAAAEAAAEEIRRERQAELEAEADVLARAFAKHAAAPGTVTVHPTINIFEQDYDSDGEPTQLHPDPADE